jgi:DNA-binding GntR family transcriptional regulator
MPQIVDNPARDNREQAPSSQIKLPRPSSERILLLIEHENLEDKIYVRLRTLILERHILPGERIQVGDLARAMGVSRTPVMAALKRLENENAVDFVARRGVFVKQLTRREIARLFEMREMLEGLAARRAATRIRPEEVDEFTKIFQSLDLAATPEALARYIAQDRRFHLRLVEIAENAFLTRGMDAVNLMIFTYQMGLARPPAETIVEHFEILDALRQSDPDAAEAAMRLHMRRSAELMDQEADAEEGKSPSVRPYEAKGATPDAVGLREVTAPPRKS